MMLSIKSSCGLVYQEVESIFFDKDGTLIDSHFYWGSVIKARVSSAIERFGLRPSSFERLCSILGFDIKSGKLSSHGPIALVDRKTVIETFTNALNNEGADITSSDIEDLFDDVSEKIEANISNIIKPIESALIFLRSLLELKLPISIITSDSLKNTKLFMEIFGFSSENILLVCRDNCPHPKKTGLPAIEASSALNTNISKSLIIGDAPMDFYMAKNSGSQHLLVSTGQIKYNQLKNLSPYVVESLSSLEITN